VSKVDEEVNRSASRLASYYGLSSSYSGVCNWLQELRFMGGVGQNRERMLLDCSIARWGYPTVSSSRPKDDACRDDRGI
jgi:hypothetical protein